MGSNPIRATDRVVVGRYAMLVLRSASPCSAVVHNQFIRPEMT